MRLDTPKLVCSIHPSPSAIFLGSDKVEVVPGGLEPICLKCYHFRSSLVLSRDHARDAGGGNQDGDEGT